MAHLLTYIFLCSILLCNPLSSQGLVKFDSIPKGYFDPFDVVLIGEQHFTDNGGKTESALISLINKGNSRVCFEAPVEYNYIIDTVYSKRDTIKYQFDQYWKPGAYKSDLLRFLYNSNITPKAIDILRLKSFSKDEVLSIYNSHRPIPQDIESEIVELKEIGPVKFPNRSKNIDLYYEFLQKFNKDIEKHKKFLGEDSSFVIEYFNAFSCTLNEVMFPVKDEYLSECREEYMFEILSNEIKVETDKQLISINGCAHVQLDTPSLFSVDTNFRSMALRLKMEYPNKKICSVYLLQRKGDPLFEKYFPEQLKYIKENTKEGNKYFIDLNSEDKRFEELKAKFTCIVVY